MRKEEHRRNLRKEDYDKLLLEPASAQAHCPYGRLHGLTLSSGTTSPETAISASETLMNPLEYVSWPAISASSTHSLTHLFTNIEACVLTCCLKLAFTAGRTGSVSTANPYLLPCALL